MDKERVSLKQLEAVYKLENEQTITSVSSGASRGSDDSGITSLYASNVDLRAAEEGAMLELGVQDRETQSTVSAPVKEGEVSEVEAGPLQPSRPKLLDFSVLKDGAFIWYSLFGLFATLGFFAPQLYVIELSKSRGVEQNMASYMLSVMAVAEIFGRLSIGVVLNKVSCRKTLVLLGCVVLLCLVLVAFTVVWEFWGLVVCCTLYGYFLGTVASTHIPMLAEEDVVGVQKMASCVGVYVFIQSFAGLAGPPLGGNAPFSCLKVWRGGGNLIIWVRKFNRSDFVVHPSEAACVLLPGVLVDVTHNYGAAFYSCAAGMGVSAICLAMVGLARSGPCQRHSSKSEEEEKTSQDDEQVEFLEVDFAQENSPARQVVDPEEASVI